METEIVCAPASHWPLQPNVFKDNQTRPEVCRTFYPHFHIFIYENPSEITPSSFSCNLGMYSIQNVLDIGYRQGLTPKMRQ